MRVKCIDSDVGCCLTIGKEYTVNKTDRGMYFIHDDVGRYYGYFTYRFKVVDKIEEEFKSDIWKHHMIGV